MNQTCWRTAEPPAQIPLYYSFHGTCLITLRITASQLYHFINYQHFISISKNTRQLKQMDILLFTASTRSAFLMKKFRLVKISLNNTPMLHKNLVQKGGPTKRSRFALVNITRKFWSLVPQLITDYFSNTRRSNKTHTQQFVISR